MAIINDSKEINNRIDKVVNNENSFSLFNFIKTEKKKFMLLIFSAFLFSFATTSLLTKAGTIPTGLTAISVTISFISPIVKPYLNFIYLGLNIPLFIIFWKLVKKSYIYITMIFLILSSVFGFFIGFDFKGDGTGSFDHLVSQYVFILCPPTNEREHLYAAANDIKNMASVSVNDYYKFLNGDELPIKYELLNNGLTIAVQKGWPIFVYSLFAVVLAASSAAIAWKCGGSVGGTDIIAYFYSTKYKKAVGAILTIIGGFIVAGSLIIVWMLSQFGPKSIAININGFQSLISLQTLASGTYIILYGKILNMIYPKYAKVIVKIDTLNVELIKEYFAKSKFNHPYKIHTLTSGRTGKNIYTFETIVLLLEVEQLIKNIKQIDPTAWISRTPVQKIYGSFDYSRVE